MNASSRVAVLCLEANRHAVEVLEQLEEFAAANAHGGRGTYRDPSNLFLEIREEMLDLRETLREQNDEIERESRGMP